MPDSATHVAFADESYYTSSRYRSIAVISMESGYHLAITKVFAALLQECSVREFKWHKLRQARERFAAIAMIDRTLDLVVDGRLRVDVLVWDTYDSRHAIQRRDDLANLQRMYYHLFKNVLQFRWPSNSIWSLYPDENSVMDWRSLRRHLEAKGVSIQTGASLFDQDSFFRIIWDFSIEQIHEVVSSCEPLCQLADLFAGIGVYSYSSYNTFEQWLQSQTHQLGLWSSNGCDLSNRDRERCKILKYLDESCKSRKLRVGLRSSRGLKTYDPTFPVNFWKYEPQHSDDIAPVIKS